MKANLGVSLHLTKEEMLKLTPKELIQRYLQVPMEKWPFRISACSANSEGKVNSAILEINGKMYYIYRRHSPERFEIEEYKDNMKINYEKAIKEFLEELLQILEDTCNFYNLDNRCTDEKDQCQYWTEEKPHGCAVGRLMSEEERKSCAVNLGSICIYGIWLPPSIQKYPKKFLYDLQVLHDRPDLWDDNGLSPEGRKFANKIKEQIHENYYL